MNFIFESENDIHSKILINIGIFNFIPITAPMKLKRRFCQGLRQYVVEFNRRSTNLTCTIRKLFMTVCVCVTVARKILNIFAFKCNIIAGFPGGHTAHLQNILTRYLHSATYVDASLI